jgi:Transglycosylase SLT domain
MKIRLLRRTRVGRRRIERASRRATRVRAVLLLPVALLSAASTAQLHQDDPAARDRAGLPDHVPVPTEAVDGPASYSQPGRVARGVPRGSAPSVVATAARNGIPAAALAAYQRAEAVMNAADHGCGIDWQLIGAIGRVESDHGRYGGNTLGRDGVSRPGIYGIALDGTSGTAEIADTDGGRFDRDTVYDRAVGPMQFIPSTWSEVGVDADGDGKRNPQDVDDAALASAVYLCAGNGDLRTVGGRRAAVHRYNHSQAYVDLVLSVREAYLEGEYTAVPTYATSAVTIGPGYTFTAPTGGTATTKASGAKTGGVTSTTTSPPSSQPQPTSSTEPAPSKTHDPVKLLTETLEDTVQDPATLGTPVATVLSLPQAIVRCTSLGLTALTNPIQWTTCIAKYTSQPS